MTETSDNHIAGMESDTRSSGKQPGGFLDRLARAQGFKKLVPQPVKDYLRRRLPAMKYHLAYSRAEDLLNPVEEVSTYPARVPVRLGILKDIFGSHRLYVNACRNMGVSYRLVDIFGADWIDVVRNSGCEAFLVAPRIYTTTWRLLYDERLRTMVEDLGLKVFPSYQELWMYESKKRMYYWLKAHGFTHPETWIFYAFDEALSFAETCALPIVVKSDVGWGAGGVKIIHERNNLKKYIKRCFGKGITTRIGDFKHTEWGSVFLQEYIPGVSEWRMIRLGSSYFGRQKLKVGEFHSGTRLVGWYDPPEQLLDLTRQITERGGFRSINLDIFETDDGRYLVNELQAIFGCKRRYQMLINGKEGRYIFDEDSQSWRFEEGAFCQYRCCNLRIHALLAELGHQVDLTWDKADSSIDEMDRQDSIRDYAAQVARETKNRTRE